MLIVNIMVHRDSVMDLIDINTSETSEPTHFILPIYSAVKSAAALMKNFNAVKQKKLTFL